MDIHTKIITAYTSQSYIECITLIDSAPPSINNSSHLKTLKASCLINIEGKCAEAFEILNKIIEEDPTNGLAFYSKGLAHLKEGKLEQSIECFNMAANMDTKGAISKAQVVKLKEDVMRMKAECVDKENKPKTANLNFSTPNQQNQTKILRVLTKSADSIQVKMKKAPKVVKRLTKSPRNAGKVSAKASEVVGSGKSPKVPAIVDETSSSERNKAKQQIEQNSIEILSKLPKNLKIVQNSSKISPKVLKIHQAPRNGVQTNVLTVQALNPTPQIIIQPKVPQTSSETLQNTNETLQTPPTSKKSPKKRSLTCKICQRTFAQSFSLSRHILIHTGERPHRCEICNAGFIQKSDLNRHMSIHNEATNFECLDCGKKFKTKKNLSCHQLTHSELRPYQCRECDKSFRYKRLLNYHEGMHLKVKPFHCDFCGKEFSAKPNLKSHLKTHMRRFQKLVGLKKNFGKNFMENSKNSSVKEENQEMQRKIAFGRNLPRGQSSPQNNDENSPQNSTISPSTSSATPQTSSQTIQIASTESFSTHSPPKLEPMETLSDYISTGSESVASDEVCGNSEWNFFFKSLVPDLNKMNDKQKRKFKTKTFALIDEILQ